MTQEGFGNRVEPMTDSPSSASSQPELPPPPRASKRGKTVAVVVGVLVTVLVVLLIVGLRVGDNRNEKLAEKLPESIEENFRDKGIEVVVSSVSCDDLPTEDSTFSIQCEVMIEGIDEIVEATVQGSVDDDFVQIDEVFSEERLLSVEKAVEYVQGLIDQSVENVKVLDCDLGGTVAVIRTGSEFTCTLDSSETVLIAVAADGSGEITDVFATTGS